MARLDPFSQLMDYFIPVRMDILRDEALVKWADQPEWHMAMEEWSFAPNCLDEKIHEVAVLHGLQVVGMRMNFVAVNPLHAMLGFCHYGCFWV